MASVPVKGRVLGSWLSSTGWSWAKMATWKSRKVCADVSVSVVYCANQSRHDSEVIGQAQIT